MKHYVILLTTLVAGVVLFCCCASMRIPYRWLPDRAKTFVEHYFPGVDCLYAERDRDDGRKEYEVKLSNGVQIDFTSTGEWKKVDCGYSFVPAGIVPEAIVNDVAARYSGSRIYKIERARGGYEVKIGNGIELIYSQDGTFVRQDF